MSGDLTSLVALERQFVRERRELHWAAVWEEDGLMKCLVQCSSRIYELRKTPDPKPHSGGRGMGRSWKRLYQLNQEESNS